MSKCSLPEKWVHSTEFMNNKCSKTASAIFLLAICTCSVLPIFGDRICLFCFSFSMCQWNCFLFSQPLILQLAVFISLVNRNRCTVLRSTLSASWKGLYDAMLVNLQNKHRTIFPSISSRWQMLIDIFFFFTYFSSYRATQNNFYNGARSLCFECSLFSVIIIITLY